MRRQVEPRYQLERFEQPLEDFEVVLRRQAPVESRQARYPNLAPPERSRDLEQQQFLVMALMMGMCFLVMGGALAFIYPATVPVLLVGSPLLMVLFLASRMR